MSNEDARAHPPHPHPGPTPPPPVPPPPTPPPPPAQPNWPYFTGTATKVGTSPSGMCDVYYDTTLGAPALAQAEWLISDADRVIGINNALFGTVGGKTQALIWALMGQTNGSGGADHWSCNYATGGAIGICASYGATWPGANPSQMISGLFAAELSECSMNNNLCEWSNGEALSRWVAMQVSNNALGNFFSVASGWQQAGMIDYVDSNLTDQDYHAVGCGMAFLSWLQGVKKIPLSHIAPEMVRQGNQGTLASLYTGLTGQMNAWADFYAACQGVTMVIGNDDPFNGLGVASISRALKPTPTV